MRILVCDDHPIVRRGLREILEQAGAPVTVGEVLAHLAGHELLRPCGRFAPRRVSAAWVVRGAQQRARRPPRPRGRVAQQPARASDLRTPRVLPMVSGGRRLSRPARAEKARNDLGCQTRSSTAGPIRVTAYSVCCCLNEEPSRSAGTRMTSSPAEVVYATSRIGRKAWPRGQRG